ncbi:MAG: VOC family protein, partial [Candidatus Rokuibacteriota bacterium]
MRQICLVARRLAPVVEEVRSVLGLEVCHRDPGVGKYGLENALFAVGHDFIEVVAPVREGTTAGRYLDRRGGDGGYMVITQCDDLAPRRKRCEALGVRIANEIGHPEYRELQLHPRDIGAAMLSFGWQEGAREPGGPWHPAAWRGAAEGEPSEYKKGRGANQSTAITDMTAADLQSDDPERLA